VGIKVKTPGKQISTGTVRVARAMMRRWKKEGNHFPPNNKLVQEPEVNEQNRCPDTDSNKTKIYYAKDPNEAQRTL
jgi:hypothetical protein